LSMHNVNTIKLLPGSIVETKTDEFNKLFDNLNNDIMLNIDLL